MLIERHLLEEKLGHLEERWGVSPSPAIFHDISVALRFGDARSIELTVAMARLLREAAQTLHALTADSD